MKMAIVFEKVAEVPVKRRRWYKQNYRHLLHLRVLLGFCEGGKGAIFAFCWVFAKMALLPSSRFVGFFTKVVKVAIVLILPPSRLHGQNNRHLRDLISAWR